MNVTLRVGLGGPEFGVGVNTGNVGVKTGVIVGVLELIAPPSIVAVGVANSPPGIPLVGGSAVTTGVGVSCGGMGEMTLLELMVELPNIIDATDGDEGGIDKGAGPLIVMSAESLSVVPFEDEIVAVNIQATPEAFA